MSSNEEQVLLENVIGRVQKKFENGCSDEKKYKYLKYLENLDVDVHILRKTGIGKLINGYRKEEGVIGKKATELIIKWKNIADNYSKQDKVNKDKCLQQDGINDIQKYQQKNEQSKTHDSTSISAKHQIPYKDIQNIMVSHEKSTTIPCQRIPQKDIRNIVIDTKKPLSHHSSLALKNEKLSKKIDEISVSRLRDNSSNQHSETNTSFKNKYSKPTDDFTMKRKKQEEIGGDNGDSDPEDEEKYKNASFADMLMMPMLNLKKKKKMKKDSPLKKAKISKMPSLPEIQLPNLATPEPVYTPTLRPPNPPPKSGSEKTKSRDTPSMYVEIVSRKTRSHMYTGKKQSTGTVVSLYQQCMRVLIENVDSLYDTGGVPYEILKPLLAKCNPYHLERLEECNPHFLEDTDILWKAHCQREFKGHQPDEMETWRELFKRLGEEREARLHNLSKKITSHQAAKVPERSVKLAYVSTGPKPSPQVLRKQKKHGTGKDIISERKKELKEKLESDSRDTGVAVPFTNVPRRDRCIKRPPSSLTHGGSFHLPEPKKKKKEGLGSSGPSHLMPTQRKPGKKPMMAAALKSLKNMKGRMASQIVRK